MRIVDLNRQPHVSKIIVPNKTKVENESLMNNNDLNCLKFDECDTGCIFDYETRTLYSTISVEERQLRQKE